MMKKEEHQPQMKEEQPESLSTPEHQQERDEKSPQKDLPKITAELEEYKDKYLRLYAEFDNARKRYEREKFHYIKYANEGILVEFLGILDDLERTVQVAQSQSHLKDNSSFLKGVEMVMGRVNEFLKKNDVNPMDTVGKKFDPHSHEILMQVVDHDKEDGIILEEYQKGYCLGEKVIRTAKVQVAVHQQTVIAEEQKPPESPAN